MTLCWEKKEPRRELGRDQTDCISARKTGANGKALPGVAETAAEGNETKHMLHRATSDFLKTTRFLNFRIGEKYEKYRLQNVNQWKNTNKWYIVKYTGVISITRKMQERMETNQLPRGWRSRTGNWKHPCTNEAGPGPAADTVALNSEAGAGRAPCPFASLSL